MPVRSQVNESVLQQELVVRASGPPSDNFDQCCYKGHTTTGEEETERAGGRRAEAASARALGAV